MASVAPADTPQLDAFLRSSLQSKFAGANEESEAHGESWQSRDAPKAGLTMLPLPTDVAILRRYAAEAEKQNLREHVAQVYASAKILALAVVAFAISIIIVTIGTPAKWLLNVLDNISLNQKDLLASLKARVSGERAQQLLALVETVANYLLDLAERFTGRQGLADRARQTASQTKQQITEKVTVLESDVQKKKELLLNSLENGKKELREREASVSVVVKTFGTEIVKRAQTGAKEVYAVVSPLRSGLQPKRRVNEFIAVSNIVTQTAFAVFVLLALLPREVFRAVVGRSPAPLSPSPLKKTE